MSCTHRIEVAVATDTGTRSTNADAYLIDEAASFYGVSDAMGDTPRSAAVARMALKAVREMFADVWAGRPPGERRHEEARERLVLGVLQANGRLHVAGRARQVGATLTAVVLCGSVACIVNVGDSRTYLFDHETGTLRRLTTDDTVRAEAMRRGEPEEVAAKRPHAHALTRAIGGRPVVRSRISIVRWHPRDRLALVTDGVSDHVPREGIAEVLRNEPVLGEAAERLIGRARATGGGDNATALLLGWTW